MFGKVLATEQVFGTMAPMERTYVRRRILVLVALSAALAPWMAPLRAAVSSEAPLPVSNSTYVVRQGDSLWAIAERLEPGQDPRILADAIAEENSLDPGALQVGLVLAIPAR